MKLTGAISISLHSAFDEHSIMRRWIPKARAKPEGAPAPRPGTLLAEVKKIVIGDTGWRGLTAGDAARDLGQAYGHFIVDDKAIIECVPALTSSVGFVEQACFVQSKPGQEFDAQKCAIAINLCFGGRTVPKDPVGKGQIVGRQMYDRCVALVAFLCDRFELDPAKDVKRAGDLDISRTDPDLALEAAGTSFDQLLKDVSVRLKPPAVPSGQVIVADPEEVAHA
jgi:hypothetical protein